MNYYVISNGILTEDNVADSTLRVENDVIQVFDDVDVALELAVNGENEYVYAIDITLDEGGLNLVTRGTVSVEEALVSILNGSKGVEKVSSVTIDMPVDMLCELKESIKRFEKKYKYRFNIDTGYGVMTNYIYNHRLGEITVEYSFYEGEEFMYSGGAIKFKAKNIDNVVGQLEKVLKSGEFRIH